MAEKKEEKLTPQELAVKRYLDEQSENDDCLRSFYIPSKIKDCFKYITEQARKEAVSGCAMIEDSVVYKWARDYYIEFLPKEADKKTVEVVQKKAEEVKPIAEKKEVTVVKNGQRYDKDGCALLFDFGD
jgi:hypothetical protein